jgi:signal transduction histidine kinase
MTGEGRVHDDEPAVPLDLLPDPALRYVVREGEPVVERVNEAFATRFGRVEPATPIEACYQRCGLEPRELSMDELETALATEDRLSTEVVHLEWTGTGTGSTGGAGEGAQQAFQLRALAAGGDRAYDGCLTLTPLPLGTSGAVEVDRLASVISHDLRNPLDVAKARVQAARETGDPEHFEHVARAHRRMERIIRDVLTLARGEGAITPSEDVAIESIAADAWETVDTGAATLDLEEGLPAAEADADRLRRVFENLFRNSIEHGKAPTGTDATTRVRVGPAGEDGFFIADDGPGVDPEERDRVFAPGYSSRDSGTGLGMTIVRQIARAHGWTVSLTASATGGARVEFHDLDGDG